MTIARACYSNRAEVQRSVDFRDGVDVNSALDRAMQTAANAIDEHMHRRFYPNDATVFKDWPNYDYATPWRIWFDQFDCVQLGSLTTGGSAIPLNQVFLRPQNNAVEGKPWYTWFELDRSTSAALGGNAQTPQNAVVMSGTWGYGADADIAGTLAANVGTTDVSITVSDGSKCGPGDLVILSYGRGTAAFPSDTGGHAGAIAPYVGERMIITDAAWVTTGLSLSGAGCTTAVESDNQLSTSGSGALNPGETVQIDGEHMLVLSVASGVYTMRRAVDGTVIATHATPSIYGLRQMSVLRAQYGTVAGGNPTAGWASGANVWKHRVPPLIKDLSIAEAQNQILQEGSGYARIVSGGDAAMPAPGVSLAEKWDEARTAHARKARIGAI